MTDITERLRQNARSEDCFTDPYPDVLTDAADEIDRLRARLNTAGHAHLDGAHLSRKVDGCLLCEAMTERDELRARVAELEAQRDAAFEMSRCECDSDEACANLVALHRKVAELETEKENFDHAKSYIVDLEAKIVELEAARGDDLYSDVYDQCCALIEPHVVREGKHGGFLPGSVVESLQALLEYRIASEAARGEPAAYLHQVVCGDGEPDKALSFAPDNFPLAGVLGYRSLSHVPLYTAPPAPTVDVDAISDEALNEGWEIVMNAAGDESGSAAHDMRAALRAIFNKGK